MNRLTTRLARDDDLNAVPASNYLQRFIRSAVYFLEADPGIRDKLALVLF